MTAIANPDSGKQAPLGPHLFEILLALSSGPLHGYGIVQDIRDRTGGRVVMSTSTLYRGIERLLTQGLIAESEGPASESSAGPPRRYFRLTESGERMARQEAERLRDALATAAERLAAREVQS